MNDEPNVLAVKQYLLDLQHRICSFLEQEDGQARFVADEWQKPEGGEGITKVLSGGAVIESAGVNFSHVYGKQMPAAATALRPELAGRHFQALGISVIVHPVNPYAPTVHMNVRLFIAYKADEPAVWWFGGGFDLTPHYGFIEDAKHWHQMAAAACKDFGDNCYSQFKQNCDTYFHLKHRNEQRGIGGIFFDDLSAWGSERCFAFMRSVGDHFILGYQPILARRKNHPYGNRERDFQCYRRGRYVEFNLIYDRGTLFGLQFGGRTESILVSMPPKVAWRYNWQPEPGSEEERLYRFFLKPQDWLNVAEDTVPTLADIR